MRQKVAEIFKKQTASARDAVCVTRYGRKGRGGVGDGGSTK